MTDGATPKHSSLVEALAAAQADFGQLLKDRRVDAGPKKYGYATLAAVLDAVRPALAGHGIAIVQRTVLSGDSIVLRTELLWGEDKITSELPIVADLRNPQAFGSAQTYARRYSLCALVAVAPDDDDDDGGGAREAQASPVRHEQQRPEPPRHEPAAEDDRGQRTFPLNGKRYRADDWIVEADRVARALDPGRLGGFLEATKATRNEIYKTEAAARDRLMALSEDLKARALGAAASEGAPQ